MQLVRGERWTGWWQGGVLVYVRQTIFNAALHPTQVIFIFPRLAFSGWAGGIVFLDALGVQVDSMIMMMCTDKKVKVWDHTWKPDKLNAT